MNKIYLDNILKEIEIGYIKSALSFTGNNTTKAAELLGLNRTALVMRLKQLDMVINRPKRIVKEKKDIPNAYFARHPNNMEDDLYNE